MSHNQVSPVEQSGHTPPSELPSLPAVLSPMSLGPHRNSQPCAMTPSSCPCCQSPTATIPHGSPGTFSKMFSDNISSCSSVYSPTRSGVKNGPFFQREEKVMQNDKTVSFYYLLVIYAYQLIEKSHFPSSLKRNTIINNIQKLTTWLTSAFDIVEIINRKVSYINSNSEFGDSTRKLFHESNFKKEVASTSSEQCN